MANVGDVIAAMDRIAPPSLAMSGDPIGLAAGRLDARVRRVALTVDASLPALAEAKGKGADMVVAHHPRFYRGLSTLAEQDFSGRRATAIATANMAVYCAHTNLDIAEGGTNDCLAELAGLVDPEVVRPEKTERLIKLAVFVPVSHVEKVFRAVTGAGAGAIGKYADCTFRVRGIGTFRGGDGTNPFIGTPGALEEADEFRLETVFGEFSTDLVVSAMIEAHPYEEVAYDLYALHGQGRKLGLGRVGDLHRPEALSALAGRLAAATGSTMTHYHGRPGTKIRRVAVWAGGGVEARDFVNTGAQAVVAGEVQYHEVENLMDAGMAAIVLGHGFSEQPVISAIKKRLTGLLPECTFFPLRKGIIFLRNVASSSE